MKYFSKLWLLLLAPSLAFAQPTITLSDLPVAGTTWIIHSDASGIAQSPAITAAGPNQTWDYTSSFMLTDTFALEFLHPSATLPAFQQWFPNATMAIGADDTAETEAAYYITDSTGFYVDGQIAVFSPGDTSVYDLDPNWLIIPTPFTYSDTRSHVFKYVDIDLQSNTKYIQYTHQSFTGDAYGSLTLPSGTFPNVLRMKETSYVVDTIFTNAGGTWVVSQTNGPYNNRSIYTWLQNGTNSYLMTIEEDLQNPGTVESYSYITSSVLATPRTISAPQVQPFPNPASAQVSFPITAQGAEKLMIYDLLGKPVTAENVRGINSLLVGTSQLASGVYVYTVVGRSGEELQKGHFSIAH